MGRKNTWSIWWRSFSLMSICTDLCLACVLSFPGEGQKGRGGRGIYKSGQGRRGRVGGGGVISVILIS